MISPACRSPVGVLEVLADERGSLAPSVTAITAAALAARPGASSWFTTTTARMPQSEHTCGIDAR